MAKNATQTQFGLFGPTCEIPEDTEMLSYPYQEESKFSEVDVYHSQRMYSAPELHTVCNFKLEAPEQSENEKKRKISYDYYYTPNQDHDLDHFEYESKAEDPVVEFPQIQRCEISVKSRLAPLKARSKSFDEAVGTKSRKSASVNGRRNKRPRSSSETEIKARAPLWMDQEEIFLVGAVMKRFFKYGSLASSRKTENDVWVNIKDSFDQMVQEHGRADQPVRTKNALSRHFKFMKSTQDPSRPKFYELYKKYEDRYGKGCMFEGLDV